MLQFHERMIKCHNECWNYRVLRIILFISNIFAVYAYSTKFPRNCVVGMFQHLWNTRFCDLKCADLKRLEPIWWSFGKWHRILFCVVWCMYFFPKMWYIAAPPHFSLSTTTISLYPHLHPSHVNIYPFLHKLSTMFIRYKGTNVICFGNITKLAWLIPANTN